MVVELLWWKLGSIRRDGDLINRTGHTLGDGVGGSSGSGSAAHDGDGNVAVWLKSRSSCRGVCRMEFEEESKCARGLLEWSDRHEVVVYRAVMMVVVVVVLRSSEQLSSSWHTANSGL